MPLPTGHPPFSSFSSFHGVRAAKPLFYWLECRFVIFAIFVKNPLFLAGQKHGLPKAPLSGPREVPRKFPRLPRKCPGLPRKFPGLPRRSAVSLGSLTPSPDSQKLSLKFSIPCEMRFGSEKAHGSESAARICPKKSPPKRGLWESYFPF